MTQITGTTEAEAVAQIAREAGRYEAISPDGKPIGLLIPPGGTYAVYDAERHGATPNRKRGVVTLHEPASLAAYVNRHGGLGVQLYADVRARSITAVLNDHEAADVGGDPGSRPGWRDHRAHLQLRHSPEWEAWAALDGAPLSQTQFAEHLELHYPDVVEPDHATMLEVARTLEVTKDVAFRGSQRLENGEQQLRYEEQVEGRAGSRGELEVPTSFVLSLRVFEGTEPIPVEARLRYRLDSGTLRIGYHLHRAEDAVRNAFDRLLVEVENSTGLAALRGAAPTPVEAGTDSWVVAHG